MILRFDNSPQDLAEPTKAVIFSVMLFTAKRYRLKSVKGRGHRVEFRKFPRVEPAVVLF